ncbi:condensation domain-containing protein, partial [Mycobacterium kansasii]
MPLRITLIRTGADEFVLLLVVHHVCWDDDSWAVFFADLSAVYNRRQLSGPAPQFITVEVLEAAAEPTVADVGYWADTLRPAPEPVELPGAAAPHPSRRAA